MNISQRLKILNDSQRTVFRLRDLKDLWNDNELNAKVNAKRMVDKKVIIKIAKGLYALGENYNIYELANLIITPSYISFNSALFLKGICFQEQNTVNSVALLDYNKKIDGKNYKFFAMKKELFFNLEGINTKNNIAIALPERAILDSFYFGLLPNIDNSDKININYIKKLSAYYPKTVTKKLQRIL